MQYNDLVREFFPNAKWQKEEVDRPDLYSCRLPGILNTRVTKVRSRLHITSSLNNRNIELWDMEVWSENNKETEYVAETSTMGRVEYSQSSGDVAVFPLHMSYLDGTGSKDKTTRRIARFVAALCIFVWLLVLSISLVTIKSGDMSMMGILIFLLISPLALVFGRMKFKKRNAENNNRLKWARPSGVTRKAMKDLFIEGNAKTNEAKHLVNLFFQIKKDFPDLQFCLAWKDSYVYFYLPKDSLIEDHGVFLSDILDPSEMKERLSIAHQLLKRLASLG